MKICIIGSASSVHIQRWAQWFGKNHDVHVISEVNFSIKNVTLHIVKSYKIRSLDFIINAFKVKKIVRELKPDILHAHSVTVAGAWGAFSGWHPFVVTPWGKDINVDSHSFFIRLIQQFVFSRSDLIHVISRSLLKRIRTYSTPKKIIISSFGINVSRFKNVSLKKVNQLRKKLGLSIKEKIIISVRGADPKYNTLQIVEAFSEVINKNIQAKLILFFTMGVDPDYSKQIKSLIVSLHLESKVIIIEDFLPDEVVPLYYKLADISIMIPPVDGSPISLFETLAAGCIFLGSRIEAYEEWIVHGKNGFIVDIDNNKICNIIGYLLNNKEIIKKRLIKNNESLLKNTDFETNMGLIEKAYEKLLR